MAVIKRPLLTEKYTEMNESGVYAFEVEPSANKIEIKKAVESLYSVTVEDVRTQKKLGKPKTRYTQSRILQGRQPSIKKAIVQLAEDDFIDFYEDL